MSTFKMNKLSQNQTQKSIVLQNLKFYFGGNFYFDGLVICEEPGDARLHLN